MSVDSLPLEWDHTGDVGSSSHEDDEDDEEEGPAYFTALSGRTSANISSKTPAIVLHFLSEVHKWFIDVPQSCHSKAFPLSL